MQFGDRSHPSSTTDPQHKRLGGYLIEAGLITSSQVTVALNDQHLTGMRFGEILAVRGWVKQQTIEYLMRKVVIPERRARECPRSDDTVIQPPDRLRDSLADDRGAIARRDRPAPKPFSSPSSVDEDVSWVG